MTPEVVVDFVSHGIQLHKLGTVIAAERVKETVGVVKWIRL